jgi:type I restriction enzyme, S subunit
VAKNKPVPDGWTWTTIGDIVKFEYGKGLTQANRNPNGKIPVYGSNGIVGYHTIPLVDKPCLIVGRKGAAGAVHKSPTPCWPIDTTYFVIPPDNISLSFLYYLFSNLEFVSLDRSTAIPGLNRNDAYAVEIPLPPLLEQERIVAKIEELFTQLEAGKISLRRAQAGLKRYKTGVLKVAFEGRLVPQNPSDEPVEEFLRRLGKSSLAGKNFTSLPTGWCWVRFEDLLPEGIHNGLYKSIDFADTKDGTRLLDIKGLYKGFNADFSNCRRFKLTKAERDNFTLREGDLLINRVSKAPEGVGKSALVKFINETTAFESNMMRARLCNYVEPAYINYFLNSDFGRRQILLTAKTTQQSSVNQNDINNLVIPLSPSAEQRRIVAEIERRLSTVQEVEQVVLTNLHRAMSLRQTILRQAFEGRLVEQVSIDEPASVSLHQIREPSKEGPVQVKIDL